jgi:AmmeMemoRadiSam system protein A
MQSITELNKEEKKFLLSLARRNLNYFFKHGEALKITREELFSEKLLKKRGCFVSLYYDGELRGCVGVISAVEPLYISVIRNSLAAAFNDARFSPLTEKEMSRLKIEISILTKPKLRHYASPEDLCMILKNERPGVLLSCNFRSAVFLPQVWKKLSSPQEFLNQLCLKANLDENAWRREDCQVYLYQADVFREE